ncbi:MAG: hypothetical protein KatS3mg113_0545 [Planctomycetaceae bacterium]|nr:MAG: hypothetical protein KatS3mg113_0545 [Planctomycetaceae bacterium]
MKPAVCVCVMGCIALWGLSGCSQTRDWVARHNPITRAKLQREMRFDLAQVAEREGRWQHAADEYRALLQKDPQNPELHHRLGVTLNRLGDAEQGVAHLRQAHELKPRDPAILNDLGYTLFQLGQLEQAEDYLHQALQLMPNDKRTINNLGLCAAAAGRTEEALGWFRRVNGEAESYANVAYVLAQQGDVEGAMMHYHKALGLNPQLRPAAEALIQLSQLQSSQQQLQVAGSARSSHRSAVTANDSTADQSSEQDAVIHQARGETIEDKPDSASARTTSQPRIGPATVSFGLSVPLD